MKEIKSHTELLEVLDAKKRTYLLLVKSSSEVGKCAKSNLEEAIDGLEEVNLVIANVEIVRDIHPHYDVKTVPSLLVFDGTTYKKVVKGCNTADYYRALLENALFYSQSQDDEMPSHNVTVYTSPTCSWCTTLKTYLRKHKVYFSEVDISRDQSAAEEMVRRSGQQGVPQTEIDGSMVVGFDKSKINSLLDIKEN